MIKKKILIVGPAWPLRGGLATYNERLCREFNAQGHVCQILSFSLQYPSFLFPGKTQFSTDPKPNDIEILPQLNSINPLNWLSVGNSVANRGYDVVIFRYWMSFMAPAFGTIARKIKNKSSAKILAITDNIIPHEKKFFDSVFTNYFLNSCDGFLSMSRAVYEQVSQLQPNKPRAYVPHPMYDMFGEKLLKTKAKEELELDINTNYLLFFGFIRKYKGLQLLLESFADERLKELPLKLIIAGEFYEDRKPYDEMISRLGLESRLVLVTDFIPNNEVNMYFSAADMVVQTYLNATQSGVTQIAYYYDKPMLVTNVGGLAELVPHNKVGYITDIDKKQIANYILDFYTHGREQEFSDNIKIEKQKFTWSYLTHELLKLTPTE
ncbi:MAG: glycosyltransferase [Bacteroidetes bacterium]|nr:glycosyltransferase [Bacteroidota bacterium]